MDATMLHDLRQTALQRYWDEIAQADHQEKANLDIANSRYHRAKSLAATRRRSRRSLAAHRYNDEIARLDVLESDVAKIMPEQLPDVDNKLPF